MSEAAEKLLEIIAMVIVAQMVLGIIVLIVAGRGDAD